MDEDRIADDRVWHPGVHGVDVNMNELRGFVAHDGRAQELLRRRVGDQLDEAIGLADFQRLRTASDFEARHFDCLPGPARFAFGHADASDFRIGEDRIRNHAFGRPLSIAGNLRQQNAVIVPCGMSEHRAAAEIAGCPDAGHVRGEPIVHFDDAAVGFHADALQAEVVGIRLSAGGDEEVCAGDVAFRNLYDHIVPAFLHALDLRPDVKLDSFALQ